MVKLLAIATIFWATTAAGKPIVASSHKTSVATQTDRERGTLATHRSVGNMSPERKAWFAQAVERILRDR